METKELRRLLELAAKAVGGIFSEGTGKKRTGPTWDTWEWYGPMGILLPNGTVVFPQDNDGDSRRLEVALEMIVDNFTGEVRVKNGWSYGSPNFHTEDIPREGDPCAATRLAVLRAAAAIGEAMP